VKPRSRIWRATRQHFQAPSVPLPNPLRQSARRRHEEKAQGTEGEERRCRGRQAGSVFPANSGSCCRKRARSVNLNARCEAYMKYLHPARSCPKMALCVSTIPGLSARRDANASSFCWMAVSRAAVWSPESTRREPLHEPSAGVRRSFELAPSNWALAPPRGALPPSNHRYRACSGRPS